MDTGSLARDAEREGGLDKALKGGALVMAQLRIEDESEQGAEQGRL